MTLAAERLFDDQPPPCTVLLAAPAGLAGATRPGRLPRADRRDRPKSSSPRPRPTRVAILTQLLVAFGTAVGRGAYFQIEATRHHPHEFLLLVGESSRARKGTAWDHVRRLICEADPTLQRGS